MKRCVLVIDDDNMFTLMANVLLRETGITTRPTIRSNGQEALALLRRQLAKDTRFLVFLAINMPLVSGWEVLDAIQELPFSSNVDVVIVTSSVDKADKAHALLYERVADYMIKPIKREDLLALKAKEALRPFFNLPIS